MTEEKIKKGKELLERLNWLKDQKVRWEKAKYIFRISLTVNDNILGPEDAFDIDPSFIRLNGLKLLTISVITKEIERIQGEFDKL